VPFQERVTFLSNHSQVGGDAKFQFGADFKNFFEGPIRKPEIKTKNLSGFDDQFIKACNL
jgi:hypothetical protein